ncbi:MAG TPA: protein kinase [Longimicrobium sp.]|nr:protein kinase [Longimicrobium sp.]
MPASGFEGLLTGHTLADRYHVEEVIGRGGFAAVYRATDQRLGRTVAVKVITQSASTSEMKAEMQRRFEREARAIAMLHHPNVVTVYDFGADPVLGLDFLVMELLRGEVLSDRLKRAEPIPIPEALRILREAAYGVDAGHRAGLIHRDIKPGNIFLARNDHGGAPRVAVLDFGIARFTEASDVTQLTHSGRGFLSPAYASPEQLRGERPVTPAADVFSLGVIGYHLLAREKPFKHDRLHPGPFDKPATPLRERNPAVPAAVAAVIEQAMRDDPAERFADAGAFVTALREAVSVAEAEGAAPVIPAAVITPDSTLLQPPKPEPVAGADAAPAAESAAVAAAEVAPAAELEAVAAADVAPEVVVPSQAAPEPEIAPDEPNEADFVPPPVYAAAAPVIAATAEPPVIPHHPAPVADARRDVPPPAPKAATPTRPARRFNPALLAIPLLLVLALVVWRTMGSDGGDPGPVATAPPAADPGDASNAGSPAGTDPRTGGGGTAGQAGTGGGSSGGPGGGQPGAASPGVVAGTSEPAAGGIAPEPETTEPVAAAPAPSSPPAAMPAGREPAARPPASRPSAPPARTRTGAVASEGGAGARALNRQGEALFDRGNLGGAIERFQAAVRAAPGNAYYRNNLGWALFQAGRIDDADRELNEAVRLDPRRDIAYANIGEVERAKGNIPGAIAAYERFLELNTDPRREQIAREKLRRLRGG